MFSLAAGRQEWNGLIFLIWVLGKQAHSACENVPTVLLYNGPLFGCMVYFHKISKHLVLEGSKLKFRGGMEERGSAPECSPFFFWERDTSRYTSRDTVRLKQDVPRVNTRLQG